MRYQNANTDFVIVKESSESEQVPVKCLVLAIPLKIKSDPAFDVVNLVRILLDGLIVYNKRSAQFALYSAFGAQDT